MSADKETLGVYNAQAAEYAALGLDSEMPEALVKFLEMVPDGGRVLDLGCGPGTKSAMMIAAGYAVDAVDASEGMVEFARTERGVNARLAEFSDIGCEACYDGIWANFSLLHAPKSEFPGHLQNLHRALRPNGAFHIGMKTGEGEERDSIGRFYAYYTQDELVGLLKGAGFTPLQIRTGSGKGLSGDVAGWITVRCHA